ncbi:hypothetical protein BHE74_00004541 [Ensete ventricosum]|nr:hypothetical protein BHE74_00004541 [Ensete ventricosum]
MTPASQNKIAFWSHGQLNMSEKIQILHIMMRRFRQALQERPEESQRTMTMRTKRIFFPKKVE